MCHSFNYPFWGPSNGLPTGSTSTEIHSTLRVMERYGVTNKITTLLNFGAAVEFWDHWP